MRITEFSITEEAFDPVLNPIRAKVSLGMRVLSIDDLGFTHKGGSLFMSYLQTKEQLRRQKHRWDVEHARDQGDSMNDPIQALFQAGALKTTRFRPPAAITASTPRR